MNITVNGAEPGLKISNLADLKRVVAMPGIQIVVVDHWLPYLNGTTRTPTKVQGNGYWFMAPNKEGEVVRMWADHPRAAELAFPGDDRVFYHPNEPRGRSWTLRFVPPAGWSRAR